MLRALVLVGGLGTRLRAAVADRPKSLAPVGERPFLDIQLDQMAAWGVEEAVLLAGYRAEQVAEYAAARMRRTALPRVSVVVEPELLGTAGALRNAASWCDQTFLMCNGDTFFELDARKLLDAHRTSGARATLAACRVSDTSRYGALALDGGGRVAGFVEKSASSGAGWINAGVYAMEPSVLELIPAGRAVSLEREIFPRLLDQGALAASPQGGSFFDIGTPASYQEFIEFLQRRPAAGSKPGDQT